MNDVTVETSDSSIRPTKATWLIIALLMGTLFVATYRNIYNKDIFTHLACGEWMLDNGNALDTAYFSVDADHPWINIHWLFEVLVASLYRLGGAQLLLFFKVGLGMLTLLILMLGLRKHAPPAWLGFVGLFVIQSMATRIRVRPEIITFLFLTINILLIDSARRDGHLRTLWWLVPIQLIWVNMHGLYFLGPAVCWAAYLGAWLDRKMERCEQAGHLASPKALFPLLAILVVCLVTPWPIEVLSHPFLLWTRISGEYAAYSLEVLELQPSWTPPIAYPLETLFAGVTLIVMILRNRRLPIGHIVWFLAFGALALMARRNIGLLGPVYGFLLGWHGWAYLQSRIPAFPKRTFTGRVLTATVAILCLFATWFYGSQITCRWHSPSDSNEMGLASQTYPIAAARYLSDLPTQGDLLTLDFGDAGAFIYFFNRNNSQKRRVFMDGRLEAHSIDHYMKYRDAYQRIAMGEKTALRDLPDSVRFIWASRKQPMDMAGAASHPDLRLLFVDPTGALFVRKPKPGELENLPREPHWSKMDLPIMPDGSIQSVPFAPPNTWYRRGSYSELARRGMLLLNLAAMANAKSIDINEDRRKCHLLGIRYLEAACKEPHFPQARFRIHLAMAYLQIAKRFPAADAMIDPNLQNALKTIELLDLSDLRDPNIRKLAASRVHILFLRRDPKWKDALQTLIGNLPANISPNSIHELQPVLKMMQNNAATQSQPATPPTSRPIAPPVSRPAAGV